MQHLNRRKAIRSRCLDCSGFCPRDIRTCVFVECPLFSFRMGTGKQDPQKRNKAIREYCLWCMNAQHYEVTKCPSIACSLYPYRKTKVDKSTEIKSLPKKRHIGGIFQDKTENEYKTMVGAGDGEKMLFPQV
jgi:hypothetical protein